ncbi:MAG: ribonuclease III [Lachnospiraceae bacterium]|nr:ribonuclease III [Lachnospiraceae bacterium]
MNKAIKETFQMPDINADQYSPLTLAYMGDCAYEIVIRTLLVHKGNTHVDRLNKRASNLAKASTQSQIIGAVLECLTEEEVTIYKRGRNAKSYTSAKNASINDYRRATGFETLIGWLYLKGDFERMTEIIRMGFEAIGADILEKQEPKEEAGSTDAPVNE